MLLLSREDIKKVFTMKEAVEADKEAFTLFSQGKSVVPLRTNISAPKYDGAFLFMPSYVEEMNCSAIKIVNVFPKNIDQGLPTKMCIRDSDSCGIHFNLDGCSEVWSFDSLHSAYDCNRIYGRNCSDDCDWAVERFFWTDI